MVPTKHIDGMQKVVTKYCKDIVRLVFAYVKNLSDAEDITQDVFLIYMLKAPIFESEIKEKAWLMRVAVNKSKDYLKSWWRKQRSVMPEDLSELPSESGILLQTVLEIPEKYRLPIYLFYYEGYSIKEIARILGSNSSTVGTWLERGRNILGEKLRTEYDE